MSESEKERELDYWRNAGVVEVVDGSREHHVGNIIEYHNGFLVMLDLFGRRRWINTEGVSSIRELDLERGPVSKMNDNSQRTLAEMAEVVL